MPEKVYSNEVVEEGTDIDTPTINIYDAGLLTVVDYP